MFNLENAPLAKLQFQSYSRMKPDGIKETWHELCAHLLYAPETGLLAIGKFNLSQLPNSVISSFTKIFSRLGNQISIGHTMSDHGRLLIPIDQVEGWNAAITEPVKEAA